MVFNNSRNLHWIIIFLMQVTSYRILKIGYEHLAICQEHTWPLCAFTERITFPG